MCVSDGWGPYGNNEYCQMRVGESMTITSTEFSTEYGFDFITVNGVSYTAVLCPMGR
jgi:hypothetical protein